MNPITMVGQPLITYGLDITEVGDRLSVIYRASDNKLQYAEYDGLTWTINTLANDPRAAYCSITNSGGLPLVVFNRMDTAAIGGSYAETFQLIDLIWRSFGIDLRSTIDYV